jgi:peptidoglycan-associated lipoprotein
MIAQRMLSIACLMVGAVLIAGCPKSPTTGEAPTAGAQVGGASSKSSGSGASTAGSAFGDANGANGANGARGLGAEGTGVLARKVIYFDFDRSEIKPEFADIVKSGAQNLTGRPGLKVKLEGNTDERGTREYNIGLGERRAQAVRRALLLQGVAEAQITTVSFGAERPAAEGDDETAWAQNRRVELVYLP